MKPGSLLEYNVQQVYSFLLNLKDEGVTVSKNVRLCGRSGVPHEFDVYYEFERAGVAHRVAIECKDWSKPVSKGKISEFESKIRELGNVTGVVIARNGYQEGAEALAKHYEIKTLCFDQLPTLPSLLGNRLSSVALPDETCRGEPFWIIMEIRQGRVTGSHFSTVSGDSSIPKIPLMFSKYHAERVMREANLKSDRWAVRGLPKHALRAFLVVLELYEHRRLAGATILFLPPGALPDAQFLGIPASREDLIREYYGELVQSIFQSA